MITHCWHSVYGGWTIWIWNPTQSLCWLLQTSDFHKHREHATKIKQLAAQSRRKVSQNAHLLKCMLMADVAETKQQLLLATQALEKAIELKGNMLGSKKCIEALDEPSKLEIDWIRLKV